MGNSSRVSSQLTQETPLERTVQEAGAITDRPLRVVFNNSHSVNNRLRSNQPRMLLGVARQPREVLNEGCLLHLEEAISLSKVIKAASEAVLGSTVGSGGIVAIPIML